MEHVAEELFRLIRDLCNNGYSVTFSFGEGDNSLSVNIGSDTHIYIGSPVGYTEKDLIEELYYAIRNIYQIKIEQAPNTKAK